MNVTGTSGVDQTRSNPVIERRQPAKTKAKEDQNTKLEKDRKIDWRQSEKSRQARAAESEAKVRKDTVELTRTENKEPPKAATEQTGNKPSPK